MAKDPAFLFYYQDFLVGTEFMEEHEVGIYIRLLCHQADKGRLSEKHMLSICKAYGFTKSIKEKFVKDKDGLYYNERLELEIQKRRKYSESRRNNAKSVKAYAQHMENENEDVNKDINSFKEEVKRSSRWPMLKDVIEYFEGKLYPKEEAETFWNHYESIGWVNGNGIPIANWRVKAENWHKEQTIRNFDKKEKQNGNKHISRGRGAIDPEQIKRILNEPD